MNFKIFYTLAFFIIIACNDNCEIPIQPENEVCNSSPAPIYHPGEMEFGRVAGLKNCLPFMASASADFVNSKNLVGLSIQTFEDWGGFYANKEFLMIGVRAYGIGSWPLLKDSIPNHTFQSYSTVQDHDVFEDVFRIDPTYNLNRIILTKFDTINNTIQGSFDARFILSSSFPSGTNPDTVVFNDCHFTARKP